MFFDYLEKIVQDNDFHLIIDLTKTRPPNVVVRNALRKRFKMIDHQILSYNICVGNNFLLKTAAKFVIRSIGIKECNVHVSTKIAIHFIEKNN